MSISGSEQYGLLDQLAEEFAARFRRGERPALKEYTDRYPELAAEIRELFPAMVRVEQVEGIRQVDAEKEMGDPRAANPSLKQIGDYRILREIGRGGMGVVYEAEQVSLGRRVALKVLPRQVSTDRTTLERFRREARAAARLHHTNIVPVFEVGQDGEVCYYAMQFIQGQSLDAVIAELCVLRGRSGLNGRSRLDLASEQGEPGAQADTDGQAATQRLARSLLTGRFAPEGPGVAAAVNEERMTLARPLDGSPASATDIGLDAVPISATSQCSSAVMPGGTQLSATGTSHRAFHRSVAHIGRQAASALAHAHGRCVVHRDIKPSNLILDTDGVVWVTDFGLAKGEDDRLTHTGDLLGTFRYMAPERFDGQGGSQCDVYALGLTLYELLLLRPAFDSSNRLALIDQVKNVYPPRPRSIDPRIPRDLETIVLKAIEKDPRSRYPSADAMGEDLRRFLADEPIVARPLRAWELAVKWAKRRPIVAALAAAVHVLLASLLGLGIYSYREVNRSLAVATIEGQRTNEQSKIAQEQFKAATARAEDLAWEDYINRVNRAAREIEVDNVALAEDLLHGCPPERRGWEWQHVKRLANLERLKLEATGSVNAIAFSPDGTWIASVCGAPIIGSTPTQSSESLAILWDVATGRQHHTLHGIKGCIYSVAVSPNGLRVAVGSGYLVPTREGRLSIWDAATGQLVWSRNDPDLVAMSVAFSPDGRLVAAGYGVYSGDTSGRLEVFDSESGRVAWSLSGPAGGVTRLAFHPEGRRLVVAGSGVVEVWDLSTKQKVLDLKGHSRWIYAVAYSPDGKWLATGGWDRTVKIWNAITTEEQVTISAHAGFVLDLAFSPDGRYLATTSEDRSLKLWEVPAGRELAVFHGHTDFVQSVGFRPDGREIATAGMDGAVKFWDLHASRPVIFGKHTGRVQRLAFSRDGRRILSEAVSLRAVGEKPLGWDPRTGELDPALTGARFGELPSGFEPEVGIDNTGLSEFSTSSPDGMLIAQISRMSGYGNTSRSKDYTVSSVVIREASSDKTIHILVGHTADVTCAAFSPDGRRLATASFDRTIKLWDVATGRDVFTLRGHTAGVVSLAFSPDGHRLVSGGIDTSARVWDGTPLPRERVREDDTRFQQKREMLAQLTEEMTDARRGELLARRREWSLAAEVLGKAVEREPAMTSLRRAYFLSLLEAGDLGGYRRAAADLIARSEGEAVLRDPEWVPWFCVLAPSAVADSAVPVRMAEAAVAVYTVGMKHYPLGILGAALYRAGRYDEAIRRLEQSDRDWSGVGVARNWAFLAMAHHRMGHSQDARRWLEKLRAHAPSITRESFWESVEISIFCREAESLIGGKRSAPP